MQKEKDFQLKFTRWAKANIQETCAVELKLAKGVSLPFNSVADHQIINLLSAHRRTLVFKIPDVGYDLKPFDCFVLAQVKAYIAILFHVKRGDNEFYMIPIEDFVRFRDNAARKSITKEEAKSIASIIGELKT